MKRTLVLLILLSLTSSPVNAGWFSRDKTPELEREQRIKAEEQLMNAQGKIDKQQRSISRLHLTITVTVACAVVLLLIGVALGSKAKRDENQS